jgi:hypothetical protein
MIVSYLRSEHLIEEIQITSKNTYHFMAIIPRVAPLSTLFLQLRIILILSYSATVVF